MAEEKKIVTQPVTKDILKQALKAFDGTLVVVSHDRDFLDGLVDKLYEFRDDHVKEYLGGVSDFLAKRRLESLQELERVSHGRDPSERGPACRTVGGGDYCPGALFSRNEGQEQGREETPQQDRVPRERDREVGSQDEGNRDSPVGTQGRR